MPDQTLSPADKLAADIKTLQDKINSLHDGVRLARLRDELEDLDTKVNGLEQRIAGLRTQGYVYEIQLEVRAAGYKARWGQQRLLVLNQITQQSTNLEMSMRNLEAQMAQIVLRAGTPAAAGPLLAQGQAAASALESKVNAAESTVRGMFDAFANEVNKDYYHLDKVAWMLKQIAEATFQLLPTEAGIMAVEALWTREGKEDKDDPRGIFLLTDQRLLFEQKQEIATKKVLFITTAREKVQKLLIEIPVAMVESAKGSKKGMFKNEDWLEFVFAVGAQVREASFHLFGQDANDWQARINQAKTKEFDKDRAVAIDQGAVEKARSVPSQCPSCGGAIKQVILRGQDTINCEYCGYVIRL